MRSRSACGDGARPNNENIQIDEPSRSMLDERENDTAKSHHQIRNSEGWDGKLRVDKKALEMMQAHREGVSSSVPDENNELGSRNAVGLLHCEDKSEDGGDENDSDDSGDNHDGNNNEGEVLRVGEKGRVDKSVVHVDGGEIGADEDLLEDLEEDVNDVDLVHCKISSIPPLRLERFKKIEKLCLRQNVISKPVFPKSLGSTLSELDLYDNLISKLDSIAVAIDVDDGSYAGLEALKELTSLDLSFNRVKHIRNLDCLTKLRELYLVQNKISKIEGLEHLQSLTCLELGANRIRTIENLKSLTLLEQLWLGKNKITELKGISSLRNLTILSIQSNRLTTLGGSSSSSSSATANNNDINANNQETQPDNNTNALPLSHLPVLQELYVSHNALTTLAGLAGGPSSLHVLDISSNPVSSLSGLEPLTKLEEFWASNCKIEDWREIERGLGEKSGKEKLETVYLEGNPIERMGPAVYRGKVKMLVPRVRQIDASYVRL